MSQQVIDVLVVGAGWAGLSAAQALSQGGREVVVVEKARGPGGRSATRRHDGWSFDHGAQYMTADSAAFQTQLAQWSQLGLVEAWQPNIKVIGPRPGKIPNQTQPQERTRWVGVPGNNAVLKHLALSQRVLYQHRIEHLVRADGCWEVGVRCADECTHWKANHVLITAPPQQVAALLGISHPLHATLADHPMRPCWTLMLGFNASLAIEFDAAFVNDGPLSWVCRQNSKPQRHGESWVAHASPDWSSEHVDDDPAAVSRALFDAWQHAVEVSSPSADACAIHLWRYAQSEAPLDVGHLSDPANGLWVAGDWCHGNRVEGAWLSGLEAAQSLLG